MKRHPDLSLRKPESTSLSRSMAFNKPVVDGFFEKYASVLEKYKFSADQVWNLDETGITTVARPIKVVSTKGKKQVGQIASAERGSLVTFVGIVNGIGGMVPPIFVFPRIRNPSEYLTEGSPMGSIALGNRSGWMTAELFPKVLKHIVNHIRCSADNKILLLVDNHESHISVEAIRYCKSNGIVLLSFPPHTTHRLQPLDVGVYAPFKARLAIAFNDWMLANPGQAISIRNIGYLANKAYEITFSIKNITHAFKKTGLWPINRLTFTDEDFAASSVTDRPLIPDEPPREALHGNEASENKLSTTSEIDESTDSDDEIINSRNSPQDFSGSNPSTSGFSLEKPSTSGLSLEKPSTSGLSQKKASTSALSLEKASTPGLSLEKPSTYGLSLEKLIPYPKVSITKPRSGKRKSKSTVYTDTPELIIRENIELEKKRKQEVTKNRTVKRNVFGKKVIKKKINIDEDQSSNSDISLNDVESHSSDEIEELETASEGDIDVGDYVLVKFCTESGITIHYAGRIEQINSTKYTIKFLRRRGFSQKFFFPSVEDVTDINISDIVAKLQHPPQTGTARTSSMYTFSYNFTSLNVK